MQVCARVGILDLGAVEVSGREKLDASYGSDNSRRRLVRSSVSRGGSPSQGKTVEEAQANLKEASELYFEDQPLPTEIEPPIIATLDLSA